MKLLETNFECAGFCEKSPYFLYSDINDDVEKTDTCAKVIGEEIETNFFVYMIITFAMALFMIFNIAATKCYKKPEEDTAAKYAANPTHWEWNENFTMFIWYNCIFIKFFPGYNNKIIHQI